MKIGDKVKTTPLFAKEFAEEFTGVITEIDTQRARMDNGEYHPTKICTVATIKTDTGNFHQIDIPWLMSVE
jgi:hypothetical protein